MQRLCMRERLISKIVQQNRLNIWTCRIRLGSSAALSPTPRS
jgi:hypothetical protein